MHICTIHLLPFPICTADCSQVPQLCHGCPITTTSDGLLCRAPSTCLGEDSDRDGIPNSCDSCPYNFNPNQTHTFCVPTSGVCPGGVASGILWSRTSVGTEDIKPCRPPMLGMSIITTYSANWSCMEISNVKLIQVLQVVPV